MRVVGFAAFVMRERVGTALPIGSEDAYVLQVRVAIGADHKTLLAPALESYVRGSRLHSVTTARQGLALDVTYRVSLRSDDVAGELVKSVNRLEGVQSVNLQRQDTLTE